jgi:predicted CxxxxCH...CXXCH cytochrome family protein
LTSRLFFSTLFLWTVAGACRVGGPSESADADASTDGGGDCAGCHGGAQNAAPPVGLQGEVDTTTTAVGAHQAHLGASDWHAPLGCDECHVVPATVDAEGHIGMRPAELTWGSVATARRLAPAFDGTRCNNVYCHGVALLPGGSNTAPQWTVVDGSQAACGTCHGLPPDPPHPAGANCEACHREWSENPTLYHINGTVEVSPMACNACHGSETSDAPPQDTSGNLETTAVGVGAHQAHLATGSDWHRDFACTDCHVVPATVDAAGHMDSPLPAELIWSALASADGATPSFDQATARCSGVYCHGATRDGGANTSPTWTRVGMDEAICGSCHALPPGGSHPNNPNCYVCHTAVIREDRTFVDPSLHIDGEIQGVASACDLCHGADGNPAPPLDTTGGSATTLPGVGAHRSHLATGSTWHADIACNECHLVPASVYSPGHRDSVLPAELTWGPTAAADGATPSIDLASTTCSGSYCHGATLSGGTLTAPVWTQVDGTQAACGTCHALPPTTGHPAASNCYFCHPSVVDSARAIIGPALHVNGRVDF